MADLFFSDVQPLRVSYRQRFHLWDCCSLGALVYAFLFSKALPLGLVSVQQSTCYAFLIDKGFTFGTVVHWVVDASLFFFKGFAFGFGFRSVVHLLRFVHRQRFHLWNCCSLGALVYAFLFQRLCLWVVFVLLSCRFALVYRQRFHLWNHCSLGALVYAFLFQRPCLWVCFCSVVHLLRFFVHRQRFHLWNCCSLGGGRFAFLFQRFRLWDCCSLSFFF